MSDTVIKVENLSKRYVIGHQRQERYSTLRDAIANSAKSLKQRFFNPSQKLDDLAHEEFWALKDVSFEVKQGDRVGIIGRNGAGKSTLLKILSRITEPTSGKISIKGRVASLLEVGTGFHNELTGRENIFLNGAILGMSRSEINKKFDEIVDFAEVEKFLDTPVKHYSSGMYVRLAFAVAAHLEPEILIVDEVLAVGDAAFQKKCLGKMGDVADKNGKTVLFVSHNMAAITTLCKKLMWIDQGHIQEFSEKLEDVIHSYLQVDQVKQQYYSNKRSLGEVLGNENIRVIEAKVSTDESIPSSNISVSTPIKIECTYDFLMEDALFYFGCNILDVSGEVVFMAMSPPQKITKGLYKTSCYIPKNLLNNRRYSTHFYWTKDGYIVIYQIKDLIRFEVQDIEREFGAWMGEYLGLVRPKLEWETVLLT